MVTAYYVLCYSNGLKLCITDVVNRTHRTLIINYTSTLSLIDRYTLKCNESFAHKGPILYSVNGAHVKNFNQ